MNELLDAKQLAIILDVSVRTIRRLESSGRLPRAVKIGRRVKWPRKKIDQWIDDGGTTGKGTNERR